MRPAPRPPSNTTLQALLFRPPCHYVDLFVLGGGGAGVGLAAADVGSAQAQTQTQTQAQAQGR